MTLRHLSSLVVVALCLLPLRALGNPVMVGGWMSACQVDGTRNVMLSFTCGEADQSTGECSVAGLTRDGQDVGVKWNISSYPDDLGSGISGTMFSGTVCDCNVEEGERTYGTGTYDTSITVAQVGDAEGTWCGPSTSCDCSHAGKAGETDEGGCAVAQSARPDLLVLVLLVLGLVWARRQN